MSTKGQQIAVVPASADLAEIMQYADLFYQSGMFPGIRSMAAAAVKIMAGREYGLKPFEAINAFHIVKEKLTMSADTMAKLVKRSGRYDFRCVENTDTRCEIHFSERSGQEWKAIGTSVFTIADAKRAGTQNIDKYPANMLFARALSNGVKWHCPDALATLAYVEGEISDDAAASSDADVITVNSEPVTQTVPAAPVEVPQRPEGNGWQLFTRTCLRYGVNVMPTGANAIEGDDLHVWVEKLIGRPWSEKPTAKGADMTEWWENTAEPLLAIGDVMGWDASALSDHESLTNLVNQCDKTGGPYASFFAVRGEDWCLLAAYIAGGQDDTSTTAGGAETQAHPD